MELRLLTKEVERRVFAENVAKVRMQSGVGYFEVRNTAIDNRRRLDACNLLGLFGRRGDPPDRMIGGIALHSLEAYPQSCREPDLSHLPPHRVFECSDHWSIAPGAGVRVWFGAALYMAHLKPQAILAYLAVGASDHTGFYALMGFRGLGSPVLHPYMAVSGGKNLKVQAMVLRGEVLASWRKWVSSAQLPAGPNPTSLDLDHRARLRPFLGNSEMLPIRDLSEGSELYPSIGASAPASA